MPDLRPLLLTPLLVAVALTAGCETVDSRIKHHAQAFEALSPADQQRVREAQVNDGDSSAFVRLAYGEPDQVNEITVSNGSKRLTWRYLERRHIADGVQVEAIVAPFSNGARHVEPNYKVVKVVGTEVVFMDDAVVQVRGGPPEQIRRQQARDAERNPR